MAPHDTITRLRRALWETKKRVTELEEEREVFTEMYRDLLKDFKFLYKKYLRSVRKQPFDSDASVPSCYSSSKSSVEFTHEERDVSIVLESSDDCLPTPKRISPPEYFVVGNTEPTIEQLKKQMVLKKRSQERVKTIKEASGKRAVVADAIFNLTANHLDYGFLNPDDHEFRRLFDKLRSIEAFPMAEIRRATATRLVEFGVYEKQIRDQREQSRRAVSTFVANYTSEQHRQKVLRNFQYVAPITSERIIKRY